jgi:hypothetical protein
LAELCYDDLEYSAHQRSRLQRLLIYVLMLVYNLWFRNGTLLQGGCLFWNWNCEMVQAGETFIPLILQAGIWNTYNNFFTNTKAAELY